jgi:uncharacterized membrane protein
MAIKKSRKGMYLSLLLIIIGFVFAFSSIITNDFLKLIVVMVTLCVGLFGAMKGLSSSEQASDEVTKK